MPIPFSLEYHIKHLPWSAEATENEKTLVAGNLRNLYRLLRDTGNLHTSLSQMRCACGATYDAGEHKACPFCYPPNLSASILMGDRDYHRQNSELEKLQAQWGLQQIEIHQLKAELAPPGHVNCRCELTEDINELEVKMYTTPLANLNPRKQSLRK